MRIRVAPTMMPHHEPGSHRNSRWRNLPLFIRRKSPILISIIVSLSIFLYYWSDLNLAQSPSELPHSNTVLSGSSQFAIGKKVAVIIENRPLAYLPPLILHFSSVLGSGWPIVLFTTAATATNLSETSTPFKRALEDGRIAIFELPTSTVFDSHKAVSAFLTRPWFWEQLAPAKNVLLFQGDSIICSNAPQRADDYLKYDLIGAPIKSGMGQGYNGGLSMRNREMVLEIVRKHNWEDDYNAVVLKKQKQADEAAQREKEIKEQEAKEKGTESPNGGEKSLKEKRGNVAVFPDWGTPPYEDYEDQWFFKQMLDLPNKWNGRPRANLPGVDVAKTFAVETIPYEKPLGYHQMGSFTEDPEKLAQMMKWCPEAKLCTDLRFSSAG